MTRVLKVAGSAWGQGRGHQRGWRARCRATGDPLWTVGRALHLLTPPFVVVAALFLHLLHNPLPVITLVTLVSGAYGKALWGDFLHARGIADTLQEATARAERDSLLSVQPTSR